MQIHKLPGGYRGRFESTQEEFERFNKRVKLKRRDIRVDAILDIEAANWTTFVVGALYVAGVGYYEFWWENELEFVKMLLSFEGTIWAHFGGGYDYKWLLDWAAELGYSPRLITAGSRIVSMRIDKANFCDSFALVPISLEKFTVGMGIQKSELGLECQCGKDCGGYCRINRNMSDADKKLISDYLRRDCMSLDSALNTLRDFAEENDIDLGLTVGSSAWRNVRRKHGIAAAATKYDDYKFIAEAYFGGRVQGYRRHLTPHGYEKDVNSMYPWCLATFAVPVGDSWRSIGANAQKHFDEEQPGFYKCIVDVPEMFIPPLPHRFNKRQSVSYPFGTFVGTWTLPELKHAASLGTKITVLESLCFESEAKLFAPWVRNLWDLRLKARAVGHKDGCDCPSCGKSGPLGTELKFLMNSMIGKMGSNPEQERWEINPTKIKLCTCDIEDLIRGEPCICGSHRRVSKYAFVSKQYKILDCAHIEWAAYAISYARVALHKFQMMNDGMDMVYSDTDSVYRTLPLEMNVGDDLGQWQNIGEWTDFVFVAPKVYSYKSQKKGKERLTAKAKGIALPFKKVKIDGKTERIFDDRPESGKKYTKESVKGFRAGAKLGKFFVASPLTRTLNERSGDRRWTISEKSTRGESYYPEGCTYPPHISELRP